MSDLDKLLELAKNTDLPEDYDKKLLTEVRKFISETNIQPAPKSVPFYLIFWTYLKWRQSRRPDYIGYRDLSRYFPEIWKKSRDTDGIVWYVSSDAFNIDDEELRHAYIFLIRDKIAQKRRNVWLKRQRKKRRKSVIRKSTQA